MKFYLLLFFGAMTLWADAHIFVYHRFDDSRYPTTNTSKEDLIRDFEYFKNNGYEVISLDKLVNALKAKESIPDNWVVLTIDDSYKSFYQNGLPLFKKYNYPFSLFVFVEGTHRGYGDFCTWDELKEIAQSGSLEFHSYGHKHLQKLSNEEIIKDFDKGMGLLQKHLGIKPSYFSYPYGEYTNRVKELSIKYGFEGIINQNTGAIASSSDVYDLNRAALVGKSNLKKPLAFTHLDATWVEPLSYPKDNILQKVIIQTEETKAKKAKVYISGYGWQDTALENGKLSLEVNKPLTFERSRIIVQINNKISSKLLVKDLYANQ